MMMNNMKNSSNLIKQPISVDPNFLFPHFSNRDVPLLNFLIFNDGVRVLENVSSISSISECSFIILNFDDPDLKLLPVLCADVIFDKFLIDTLFIDLIYYLLIFYGSILKKF